MRDYHYPETPDEVARALEANRLMGEVMQHAEANARDQHFPRYGLLEEQAVRAERCEPTIMPSIFGPFRSPFA